MSRNSAIDYTQFVHEFVDGNGVTRYAVAEWNEEHSQWSRPLDAGSRKLTGCHTEVVGFHGLASLGGYKDRKQALRRARYLFGELNQDESC